MIRPCLLLAALALSGCAGLGSSVSEAPPAPAAASPVSAARLSEATAAADAARILARSLPPKTRPALEINAAGGPLSAALAAAVESEGFSVVVDCRGAPRCLPAAIDLAAIEPGRLLARLEAKGALQASWTYRLQPDGRLAPAGGLTLGTRLAGGAP